MSDLISRQDAIDYIKTQRGRPFIGITLEEAIIMMIEEVPSAEPKTPSNGFITCVKSEKMHVRTMGDLISREDVLHELEECDYELKDWQRWKLKTMVRDIPSAEPERLTDDDFETIRIHLNAQKEKLCNQQRWEEAEEYQRIIDRFMAFASAEPEIIRCKDCKRYGQDNCFMKIQMLWELNPDDFCSQAERRGEEDDL